MNSEGVRKL